MNSKLTILHSDLTEIKAVRDTAAKLVKRIVPDSIGAEEGQTFLYAVQFLLAQYAQRLELDVSELAHPPLRGATLLQVQRNGDAS